MRLDRFPRTMALVLLMASVAFVGMAPVTNADRSKAVVTTAAPSERTAVAAVAAGASRARAQQTLQLAARAVGGADELRALRSYRYRTTGQRWIAAEGFRPGGRVEPSASFTAHVRHVLPSVREPGRLRVDSVRTSVGLVRPVHEVLVGRRGFIRGVDTNGSTPALKAMTSDRWAAVRAEQLLLTPHVLLRRALCNPALVRDGGRQTLDGRAYRVLILRHPVAPVRFFIDAQTGRLARLRTLQHDYLRRDVQIEVFYRGWSPAGAGLRFPRVVALWSGGQRLHREVRSRAGFEANTSIRREVFRFPDDLGPAPFAPRLARVGARTAEWITSFANLGFVKDGGQTAINPQRVAPGVVLLGGVANNSLVVRRANGVVVFEGALHETRAEAVIAFVRRRFPGLPITHVITTHHHADHSGGQRPYVALGARAVLHRAAVPFFRRVFARRSSTILPDRLDRSTRPARIVAVPPNGSLVLDDPLQRVEVYPIATSHAADMTVPFAVDSGVIFVSDIYTPGAPPGEGAAALNDLIVAESLDVEWIVGGHGGFISYDDFLADLGA